MDTTILNKLAKITRKGMFLGTMASFAMMPTAFATECNEKTMDAFAYEDCVNAQAGAKVSNDNFGASGIDNADGMQQKKVLKPEAPTYRPFERDAYLTSSFGENRGTRYHAGFDYSTQMEEGWPIYAPEDGKVVELRVSPFHLPRNPRLLRNRLRDRLTLPLRSLRRLPVSSSTASRL